MPDDPLMRPAMTDAENLQARLLMASSRRKDAIKARNRALLNIEISERNAITAEAKVAECDDEVTMLLDLKLVERARQQRLASQ
ncbi:MAG: hypothetical protein JWM36_4875 [Hyphomicrobiales bacterium]|nr:hypothetical protein [Hyphomicrobiales bacterium]